MSRTTASFGTCPVGVLPCNGCDMNSAVWGHRWHLALLVRMSCGAMLTPLCALSTPRQVRCGQFRGLAVTHRLHCDVIVTPCQAKFVASNSVVMALFATIAESPIILRVLFDMLILGLFVALCTSSSCALCTPSSCALCNDPPSIVYTLHLSSCALCSTRHRVHYPPPLV